MAYKSLMIRSYSCLLLALLLFGNCQSLPNSAPSEEQIKKDLIGKKLGSCWNFDSITEFEEFKIEQKDDRGDLVEYTASMRLRGISYGKAIAKARIAYRKQDSQWTLVSVTPLDCKLDFSSDK